MGDCWFHRWTKWSATYPGQVSWFGRPWRAASVQDRKCTKCNKQELREAS